MSTHWKSRSENTKKVMAATKTALFALCLFLGTVLSFCSKSTVYAEQKTVKVAVFETYGYSEKDSRGEWSGIEIELLNVISGYSGWKIEYVECQDWADAINKLMDEKVDLVGATLLYDRVNTNLLYGDIAAGHVYSALMVMKDSEYTYNDFEAMAGVSIGMRSGYAGEKLTREYFKKINFTDYKIVYYDTTDELKAALRDGSVDLIAHTMIQMDPDFRAVSYYSPKPFFFVSYKGNEELISELDSTLMKINMDYPGLTSGLVAEFYDELTYDPLILSKEELLYLDEIEAFRVGYLADYYPFSYEENGEFVGIARTVLDEFAREANISLEYIRVADMKEASRKLYTNEIDLLSYYPENCSEELACEIRVQKQYAESPYSVICKKNASSGEAKRVAVCDKKFDFGNALAVYDEILNYDTPEDCMKAVLKGDADVCVIEYYSFKAISETSFRYQKLIAQSNLDVERKIYFAVGIDTKTEMTETLRKLTDEVTSTEIARYVAANAASSGYRFQKTMFWVAMIALIFAIIIAVFAKINADRERIRKLTSRDAELGIWNTPYFAFHAQAHVKRDLKHKYAIVFLYLSQFRIYININGYAKGNEILQQTLDCLSKRALQQENEHYARAYGGRFVLLMEADDENRLMKRLQGIRRILADELKEIDSSPMPICFGVAYVDPVTLDVNEAIKQANVAMDTLKNSASGKTAVYDDAMDSLMKTDYEREQILDDASLNDDFLVYYQNKVDVRTEKIVGAEALVRFKNPSDGKIKSPYFFIDYYEKNGRIMKLDLFVFNQVCKMQRRRLDAGLPVVPISVNFSRLHFQDPNFVDRLLIIMNSYEMPVDLIEVEVTETAVVESFSDPDSQSIASLDRMIERGIKLSIDDFGSGYSSLGMLEQIPASSVKFDRSFFRTEKDYERKITILKSFVQMAKDLDMSIVCEGVEFEEDVELMRQIDAFVAQGYKYSKPEPEEIFEEELNANRR